MDFQLKVEFSSKEYKRLMQRIYNIEEVVTIIAQETFIKFEFTAKELGDADFTYHHTNIKQEILDGKGVKISGKEISEPRSLALRYLVSYSHMSSLSPMVTLHLELGNLY